MFARFGVDLPLPTRILIGMSDFFVNYWMFMVGVIVGLIFAFKAWVKTDKGLETVGSIPSQDASDRWSG